MRPRRLICRSVSVVTDLPFEDDTRNPFMDGDDLPKPDEGDILVLRKMEVNSSMGGNVLVFITHDSLAESWDPVGENAWTQHDVNDAEGFKGHWYAIVTDLIEEACWSVGSYEVERIVKKGVLEWVMLRFRATSENIRASITPEFIASLDDKQAAWLMEHLELLRDESMEVAQKIMKKLEQQ
jgi:hypothetical protein